MYNYMHIIYPIVSFFTNPLFYFQSQQSGSVSRLLPPIPTDLPPPFPLPRWGGSPPASPTLTTRRSPKWRPEPAGRPSGVGKLTFFRLLYIEKGIKLGGLLPNFNNICTGGNSVYLVSQFLSKYVSIKQKTSVVSQKKVCPFDNVPCL